MSHRSRRILGLVLKTKESHSDHTSARLSECVKQDTCDIPMFQKISQENIENFNPCDNQPQNDIAITTTPVLELEVTVNNTTKNDGTFHVYDNSVRERRLCTRDDPIIISPRYTDESDLDDDIEDPTYNFEDKFANFSGHINKNYLLPSRSNSDTDSTDQHVKAGLILFTNEYK
ncbi:unnamed protein product [Parnassius apollo]|uniref:(apollo) hypothetical protein n=1 Tax=Parnassius apollo TaxID=110799 RepID=A0A8S3WRI4_PARAO|nr:unnamed protein product [Parnassius apollo]